jgi:hypothetical protein
MQAASAQSRSHEGWEPPSSRCYGHAFLQHDKCRMQTACSTEEVTQRLGRGLGEHPPDT